MKSSTKLERIKDNICIKSNFTEDIIQMKSDIVLKDINGNIIKVNTPKPEYLPDLLI